VTKRLDDLLVARGLARSAREALALILAGRVAVDGRRVEKAGAAVSSSADVRVEAGAKFVSRGGLKLEAALNEFGIDVRGATCLDVGSSTGGFTDCLLQRGAQRVYAVDTGYGQIDQSLRNDPRVVLRERTNARRLDSSIVPEKIALAAVDVSFISLKAIVPGVAALLSLGGLVVVLVKPQFEALRHEVPRGGVVRDRALRDRVVAEIVSSAEALGLVCVGRTESPIRGARGNVEFLVAFRKDW
jgi:23S rRNA (cytidine1920-2'-O)/16S rRNA (cytidine1409-2'-O)-methyltransferase